MPIKCEEQLKTAMKDSKIVVITPVRNGVEYLNAFFKNIEIFADAVVFLDDGSTDETFSLICKHPLTHEVLRNPIRPTTIGWNATDNFKKLTEYVKYTFSEEDWVIYMGIDSCIYPPQRVLDLAKFTYEGDFGFGFILVTPSGESSYLPNGPYPINFTEQSRSMIKMWKNKKHYTILTSRPLHSDTHPPQINVSFSSLCFYLHYGSSTYERRLQRYKKYTEEVDPERNYQSSYEHLHPDDISFQKNSIRL